MGCFSGYICMNMQSNLHTYRSLIRIKWMLLALNRGKSEADLMECCDPEPFEYEGHMYNESKLYICSNDAVMHITCIKCCPYVRLGLFWCVCNFPIEKEPRAVSVWSGLEPRWPVEEQVEEAVAQSE